MTSLRLALLFAATRHCASFTPSRIVTPSFTKFSNSALFSSDNDFDGFSSKVSFNSTNDKIFDLNVCVLN